jgi:hypothetical protein
LKKITFPSFICIFVFSSQNKNIILLKICSAYILKLLAIVLAFSTLSNSTFQVIQQEVQSKGAKVSKKQDAKSAEKPLPQTWLLEDHGKVADLSSGQCQDLLYVGLDKTYKAYINTFFLYNKTESIVCASVMAWRSVLFEHVAAPNAP